MSCSVGESQTDHKPRFENFGLLSQFCDPGERMLSSKHLCFLSFLFSGVERVAPTSQGSVWIN